MTVLPLRQLGRPRRRGRLVAGASLAARDQVLRRMYDCTLLPPRPCGATASTCCASTSTSCSTRGSTRRRCGCTTTSSSPNAIEQEGATIVICEADKCAGPVLELPLVAIGSTRGDPTNVDVAGRDRGGHPRAAGAGAQRRRRRRDRDGAAVRGQPPRAARRPRRPRRRRCTGTARSPTSATGPGRWRAAPPASSGLGAVGRALRWRLEGLGLKVIASDPYADDAKHSLEELLDEADVVSMHAAVTPETQGMIGADAVRARCGTA